MARFCEPTKKQRKKWEKWVASRPKAVRAVAERFNPWTLYRLKDTGDRVFVMSFSTDGTVTVGLSGKYNLVLFERQVFGVDPDKLTECELPLDREPLGVLRPHITREEIREIARAAGIKPRQEMN